MAASLNTLDSVIAHFKDMDCPYFIISEDKKNIFYANSILSDIDEAGEKLREKLEDKDHTKPYHIYCFNAVKKGGLSINNKDGSVYFSYQKSKPEYQNNGFIDRGVYELMRQQNEQIRLQSEQINELRNLINTELIDDSVDDVDMENQMQPNYMGAIGQILGHPAFQPIISNILANLATNMMMPKTSIMQNDKPIFAAPNALAGNATNEGEILTECLENLFAKGVTLAHLQKLAQMPSAKIKLLLTML